MTQALKWEEMCLQTSVLPFLFDFGFKSLSLLCSLRLGFRSVGQSMTSMMSA
jgi:hypothetical protein